MTPVRLVQIVGARPQFIKLAPVSRALARYAGRQVSELIVHTGQHYDPQLSEVFFDELQIPRAAVNLEVGSGTHGRQTAAMLERIEAYLLAQQPAVVIVYGDTNSTLAGALAAAKLHIPVAHVEAGLRSFNRAMPEELNRVATDHLSDLLLAPTDTAVENLAREGLQARSHLVGDVMYDALLANIATAQQRSGILERLQVGSAPFGLVTVHRAESTHTAVLGSVLGLLSEVARTVVPLIFPVHPRTRAAIKDSLPDWRAPPALAMVEPLGPMDMLRLTQAAAVVITDSGGLQKEAFMLGRPCVTLRGETEWLETIAAGANTLVGQDLSRAVAAVRHALGDGAEIQQTTAQQARALYGHGRAAERCVARILQLARVS
jgi:UDP-N-acetylglucosamine 2-epimerase